MKTTSQWLRPLNIRGDGTALFQGAIALLTLGLGVLSLCRRSDARTFLESWIDIHVLFALLLIGFSFVRLLARCKDLSFQVPEMWELSRMLTRTTYALIYAVIGLRQILGIARHVTSGAPIDFILAEQTTQTTDLFGFDPGNDMQSLVASGVAALVVIRVLTYWIGLCRSALKIEPGH